VARIVDDLEILKPTATCVAKGVEWDDAITGLAGGTRLLQLSKQPNSKQQQIGSFG